VLVQAKERRGHFWVVIAPERHVLFRYTAKHDSAAVDGLLEGYEGYLVADAHAVFDHLYKRGSLIECRVLGARPEVLVEGARDRPGACTSSSGVHRRTVSRRARRRDRPARGAAGGQAVLGVQRSRVQNTTITLRHATFNL
jgi:hypothetical protein